MKYISTRGQSPAQGFTDILLGGLAPDGGLYMPETYPHFGEADLAAMRCMNYRELAYAILSRFVDDIPAADLRRLIDKTYTAQTYHYVREGQDAEDITPLLTLEPGLHLLSLSNGPTLAFKDMAMQLLGNLFEYELARRQESINIVGATSGDTGSAAEYAMRGKKGIRVFMLSPEHGMTRFQQAQMYSLQDPNIFNIAVHGVFDDCQDMVKAVSNDAAFKARYKIGAVNSINWARVLAQIVYYFKAYFAEGQLFRALGQFRQRLCRPCRAHDGPADRQAHRRHQRERRARRVLPHRRLPSARRRPHLPYQQPVDGHLQGFQLRALRLRPRRPRR
jgi:threonine synthase